MIIKKFLSDFIISFVGFAYEGLLILSHFISEIILTLKKIILNIIIPSILDFYTFLVYISVVIYYEFLYYSSVLFLKVSQYSSYLSKYLLTKAEESSSKKAW